MWVLFSSQSEIPSQQGKGAFYVGSAQCCVSLWTFIHSLHLTQAMMDEPTYCLLSPAEKMGFLLYQRARGRRMGRRWMGIQEAPAGVTYVDKHQWHMSPYGIRPGVFGTCIISFQGGLRSEKTSLNHMQVTFLRAAHIGTSDWHQVTNATISTWAGDSTGLKDSHRMNKTERNVRTERWGYRREGEEKDGIGHLRFSSFCLLL